MSASSREGGDEYSSEASELDSHSTVRIRVNAHPQMFLNAQNVLGCSRMFSNVLQCAQI